ncbi:MAG: oligoendopeptidase F [Candidatus Cyclobacteriaceae bacterium M3_2C_046]
MMTIAFFNHLNVKGQTKDRQDLEEKYTWNLEDIFSSHAAWEEQKQKLTNQLPQLDQYQGKLDNSAQTLFEVLNLLSELQKDLTRLYSYASMYSDQDTRKSEFLSMKQEIQQVFTDFAAKVSYVEPEILKMDRTTIENFLEQNPKLQVYSFYLNDLMRKKDHRGTAGEEKIIADASLIAGNSASTFNIFSNAEFPYPEITLSSGESVKLNQANFALHRATSQRDDRQKVFDAFFNSLGNFNKTFGTQLYGNLKKDLFYTRARNYESTLASALDANNIPTEVYHSLVKNVNNNLETFHRYLKLRKRMMGLDELHYYDLYAPLVKDVDLTYSVEEAQANILQSLRPLGEGYVQTVEKAFNNRWIDMYPTEGKRSGAYSNGSIYDVHPYILMNYNEKYDDMSTLTHELGHTMQSYLSNQNQPYPLADYPIFVAEVASTFNEALLIDYVLNRIKDDNIRLSILGNYLEGAKGTLFRQTQFAEFELKIHEMVEQGKSLTGDDFNQIYLDLTKKYYGHDQDICKVDDYIAYEWSYIPHFYYNFYVYQYATSFTASQALSEKVLAGDQNATKDYLSFLSAGGSKYPIELLQDAGVDMTNSAPFDLTINKLNRVMDEMEKILDDMDQ